MKYLAIALLGCSMAAMAQTAKVIQLTPEEAKQAKALYDEQQSLTKRQDVFNLLLRSKYLMVPAYGVEFKEGWWPGKFVFSDDFKFIVPAPQTLSLNTQGWGTTLTGNSITE